MKIDVSKLLTKETIRGYMVENMMSVHTFVSDRRLDGYEVKGDRWEHVGIHAGSILVKSRVIVDGRWVYEVMGDDGRMWNWSKVGCDDLVGEGMLEPVMLGIEDVPDAYSEMMLGDGGGQTKEYFGY